MITKATTTITTMITTQPHAPSMALGMGPTLLVSLPLISVFAKA